MGWGGAEQGGDDDQLLEWAMQMAAQHCGVLNAIERYALKWLKW